MLRGPRLHLHQNSHHHPLREVEDESWKAAPRDPEKNYTHLQLPVRSTYWRGPYSAQQPGETETYTLFLSHILVYTFFLKCVQQLLRLKTAKMFSCNNWFQVVLSQHSVFGLSRLSHSKNEESVFTKRRKKCKLSHCTRAGLMVPNNCSQALKLWLIINVHVVNVNRYFA